MVLFIALLIFVFLAWVTWAVSAACYKSTFTESTDLTTDPNYAIASRCAIAAVTLLSFIPFPLGYFAALITWGVAVYGGLNLPRSRATALFGYLAGWSVISRLVVLGVLAVL